MVLLLDIYNFDRINEILISLLMKFSREVYIRLIMINYRISMRNRKTVNESNINIFIKIPDSVQFLNLRDIKDINRILKYNRYLYRSRKS